MRNELNNFSQYISIPEASVGTSHADAGTRIISRIIDIVVELLLMIPLFFYIKSLNYTSPSQINVNALFGPILIYVIITIIGYEVILPYFTKGRTLGKIATGIRIVELNGRNVYFSTLVKRYGFQLLLSILSSIPFIGGLFSLTEFVILIVSIVFLFNDPYGQAVWDKVAGCVVVPDETLIFLKRKFVVEKKKKGEESPILNYSSKNSIFKDDPY